AGLDLQLGFVNLAATIPLPPGEGQQALPLSASTKYTANESITGFDTGAYLSAVLRPFDRLTLTPAVRFDHYSTINKFTSNTRFTAWLEVTHLTWMKGGIGLYTQPPQPPDYDKAFGNPNLRPEGAIHFSLAVEQALLPGLMLEVTGFYKLLYDV